MALTISLALTIHAIMGATVLYLVTEIGLPKEEAAWEAAQIVVLLSRTRHASHLFFKGDPDETIASLWNTLLQTDQYAQFTSHLTDKLCNQESTLDMNVAVNPFQAKETILPEPGMYCSYMVLSLRDYVTTYIGHTSDIRQI